MSQNPLSPPPPSGNGGFDRWMYLLWRRLTQAGQILWGTIDKSGSNLTDIETRNHADLQNHNTTDYYHLTQANHADLTDGGDTTLHTHSIYQPVDAQLTAIAALADSAGALTNDGAGNFSYSATGGSISNVISTPTVIAADTSYIVMAYLTLDASFTVNGNVGVL